MTLPVPGSARSFAGQLNDQWYAHSLRSINELARTSFAEMGDRIGFLEEQQFDTGFLLDDLSKRERYPFTSSRHSFPFLVQVNPRRTARLGPAPGLIPPGVDPGGEDPLCRLNLRTIPVRSGFRQLHLTEAVNGRDYAVLMNPFRFHHGHTTLTSTVEGRDPQSWENNPDRLMRSLADLCEFSRRLPGWMALFQMMGAGASIDRLHFQAFRREPEPWPLEQVFEEKFGGAAEACISDAREYPLVAYRLRGDLEEVVGKAARLAEKWVSIAGPRATENFLATSSGNSVVTLWFIPRDKDRRRAPHRAGEIGTLEVFGEIIEESETLDRSISFDSLWKMLEHARSSYFVDQLVRVTSPC